MKRNVARWIWCVVCLLSHVAHLLVLGNTVLQGLDLACRRALVLRLDLLGDLSLRLPLDCHEELKLGVGEETEHVQRRIDLDLCAEWRSSDAQRHSRQRWDGTQGTGLTRATIQPPKSEPLTSTLNMSKPISIAAETWKPKTLTAAAAESLGGDASCLYLHRPSQARHLRKEAYSAVLTPRGAYHASVILPKSTDSAKRGPFCQFVIDSVIANAPPATMIGANLMSTARDFSGTNAMYAETRYLRITGAARLRL